MVFIEWLIISQSQHELVASDMLVNVDSKSSVLVLELDLEFDLRGNSESWIAEALGVDVPTLGIVLLASGVLKVGSDVLAVAVELQAPVPDIADVHGLTSVESLALVSVVLVSSSSSPCTVSSLIIDLGTNDSVSVGPLTDSLSSPVKDEPLEAIIWVGVSKSDVPLVSSLVGNVSNSLGAHLGLKLELDTVLEWVRWEFHTLPVKVP